MANTKKATTPVEETKIVTEPIVDQEKETLKAQLAEQQSQFDQLKAQMEVMMKAMATAPVTATEPTKKDRNIPFINLSAGELILRGSKIWKISKQFEKRNFLEREARLIVNNMPNMIANGGVYIADAKFVEENDLGEIYQNLLTDKDMKTLLDRDANDIIEAYKMASEGQQEIIVRIITQKRLDGEDVDANVLVKLGNLCGKNLMEIEPLETEG